MNQTTGKEGRRGDKMFSSKTAALFMTFLFEVTTSVSGKLSFLHFSHQRRVKIVLCRSMRESYLIPFQTHSMYAICFSSRSCWYWISCGHLHFKINMLVAASCGEKRRRQHLWSNFISKNCRCRFINFPRPKLFYIRRNLIRILAFRVHFHSCYKFERAVC